MADIVRYISPDSVSSGDGSTSALTGPSAAYNSLSAWNAAEATDLTSGNDTHTVYCFGTGTEDTSFIDINSWTTASGNTITITALDRHDGTWDTNIYTLEPNQTQDATIEVTNGFVIIDGLQISTTSNSSSKEGVRVKTNSQTDWVKIQNCIFAEFDSTQQDGVYAGNIDCLIYIENCLFVNIYRTAIHSQNYSSVAVQQTWHINNNTFVMVGFGGEAESAVVHARTGHSSSDIYIYARNNLIRISKRSVGGFDPSGPGNTWWDCDFNSGNHNDIITKNNSPRDTSVYPWDNSVSNNQDGGSSAQTDATQMTGVSGWYIGQTISPTGDRGPYSEVIWESDGDTGNTNSKNFTCEVWTLSADNLDTLVATSENWSGSYTGTLAGQGVYFPFLTPFTLLSGTDYAIVVHMNEVDSSNFLHWRYDDSGDTTWDSGETGDLNNYTSAGDRNYNSSAECWYVKLVEQGGAAHEIWNDLTFTHTIDFLSGTQDVTLTNSFNNVVLSVGDDLTSAFLTDGVGTTRSDDTGVVSYDLGFWHQSNVISTVDTDDSTGDFASLNAWQAGQTSAELNLKGNSKTHTVNCQATISAADTVAVSIAGWTTTSTYKIIVRQLGAARHSGVWDNTKYRHQVDSAIGITLANTSDLFIDFDGIQFDLGTPSGNNQGAIFARTAGGTSIINVDACIFVGDAVSGGTFNYHDGIQAYMTSPITFNVTNCLFYDITRTVSYGVALYEDTANVYNCTFYNCLGSCYETGATFEVWNNLAWDAPFVGTFASASDYNSANDDTATALNNTQTTGSPWNSSAASESDIFVDPNNDNYEILIGSIFDDVGTNLSAYFTTDIKGLTR